MINQYKRRDIFRCSQEAHASFDGRVSVYHVIKEKGCYPQGCLYFLWHCVLLEKGARCIHGYRYVGKNCQGCTYYDEEKIHLQPFLQVDEKAYEQFQSDFEDFESWLDEVEYSRLSIGGRISCVKPWFEKRLQHKQSQRRLLGYLLVFKRGFIGMKRFDDTLYVRIGEREMREYEFIPKMRVEMTGEIRLDRGRIIVHRPKKVEILSRGWGRPWRREGALVAVRTATLLEEQPEQCISCRWGALADVLDVREHEEKRYRNLYCLKGIEEPAGCYLRVDGNSKKEVNP